MSGARRASERGAWSVALAFFAACSEPAAPRPPNVVVILIDTLRPDHLQPYGYEHATSPYLAELASRGVLFERAYSASTWTAPATASLFTGLYPNEHGVVEGFFVHRARKAGEPASKDEGDAQGEPRERWDKNQDAVVSLNRLPDALPTAPELFAAAGYATFGFSSNVNITSRIGFDRGFQHFADFTGPQYGKGAEAEQALEQVRAWKSELSGEKPYFLYLHFNDVHAPWRERARVYDPGAEDLAAERAAYDAELRHLDETLRRIDDELGWDDDTLVCVLSDHGEEFGEHGDLGHGYSLHAELMRIALMFSWPADLPGGRRLDTPASIVDVLPTLAQLAGVPAPKELGGVSLAPLLAGKPPPAERTLFALRFKDGGVRQLWAAQRGRWKLILSGRGPQLYDHERDPFERTDVAAEHPEVLESLLNDLRAFRARTLASEGAKVEVELDAEALRALEALGYTDGK
jgi:choline-sulfatase